MVGSRGAILPELTGGEYKAKWKNIEAEKVEEAKEVEEEGSGAKHASERRCAPLIRSELKLRHPKRRGG